MRYKLINKRTKKETPWKRIQRIHYWRIFEAYRKEFFVLPKEETRTPGRQEQWIDYRTLGTITRVKIELSELGSHRLAPPVTEFERKSIYRFLNTLESNIRNKSNSTKVNPKCQH